MSEEASVSRRRFLAVATSVTGAVGLAMTAAPFIASFRPSARAQALGAPVQVDISKLETGSMVRVQWRGQPVWILKRGKEMLALLDNHNDELRDPDSKESIQPSYAANTTRSVRPDILVVIATCTHLGCVPIEKLQPADAQLGVDWPGGFFCPCHGSKFDLAGRVYAGVPAPTNLTVPPYRFVGDSMVIVGDDTGASA